MIRRLGKPQLQEYARKAGFEVDTDVELDEFHTVSDSLFDILDTLDQMEPNTILNRNARRDAGRRPTSPEDPLNAIVRWCNVGTGGEGKLTGKRVGLKDMISVAGVPMSLGSRVMYGYVPDTDSLLVDRLLAEGAEIVAILNMDAFFCSGSGETSDYGVTRNPWDLSRTAGGSSGGSAAALYYEKIDITFGSDQGGSIRLPASWCGVLGLKPTYGLIPYTGIASSDQRTDHVGPLARTVEDIALALDAVAGRDSSDPRQHCGVSTERYSEAVEQAPKDFSGVRLGVLTEGFAFDSERAPEGTAETMGAVRVAIERIRELGATITEVSIPEHAFAPTLAFAIFVEGLTATFTGFGNGYHWVGRYSPHFALEFGKALKAFAQDLPPTVKVPLTLGTYLREQYFSTIYAKAQNLSAALCRAYDRVLDTVDFILMPAATHYAHRYAPSLPLSDRVRRGWSNLGNTVATNITGHPALSMPAAVAKNGLPVGVMVVGRRFHDADILGLVRTYERAYGWLPQPEDRADRDGVSYRTPAN